MWWCGVWQGAGFVERLNLEKNHLAKIKQHCAKVQSIVAALPGQGGRILCLVVCGLINLKARGGQAEYAKSSEVTAPGKPA